MPNLILKSSILAEICFQSGCGAWRGSGGGRLNDHNRDVKWSVSVHSQSKKRPIRILQHPVAAVDAQFKWRGELNAQVDGISWQHLCRQEVLIGCAEWILGVENQFIQSCPFTGTGIDQPPGLDELPACGNLRAIRDGEVERCAHASSIAGGFGSGSGSLGGSSGDGGNGGGQRRACSSWQ